MSPLTHGVQIDNEGSYNLMEFIPSTCWRSSSLALFFAHEVRCIYPSFYITPRSTLPLWLTHQSKLLVRTRWSPFLCTGCFHPYDQEIELLLHAVVLHFPKWVGRLEPLFLDQYFSRNTKGGLCRECHDLAIELLVFKILTMTHGSFQLQIFRR